MKANYRNQLEEKYEDALFALIMNDLMQEDGIKWNEENEALKSDPTSQPPKTMRDKSLHGIERILAKQNRKRTIRAARKIVYRIALVFLVIFIAIAVPFCTASAFRQGVLDLLIEKFEGETYVRIEPVVEMPTEFGLPWLPGEYWEKTYIMESEEIKEIRYEQETGEYIEFRESLVDNSNKTIDTEDANTRREFIGNNEVFITEKTEVLTAIWYDDNRAVYRELKTYGVERADFLTMIKLL